MTEKTGAVLNHQAEARGSPGRRLARAARVAHPGYRPIPVQSRPMAGRANAALRDARLGRGQLAPKCLHQLVAPHNFTGAWPAIDRLETIASRLIAALIAAGRLLAKTWSVSRLRAMVARSLMSCWGVSSSN